jgi:hypothetical protein
MSSVIVDEIEEVAKRLRPEAPRYRYQRLFRERDFELFEERGNYEEQRLELEERRRQAVIEIVTAGGADELLLLAAEVESPWRVGAACGGVNCDGVEQKVLPGLLDSERPALAQFAAGFVWGIFRSLGWSWVDNLATYQWNPMQVGRLLACLPFTAETWWRVARFLKEDDSAYWTRANVNP